MSDHTDEFDLLCRCLSLDDCPAAVAGLRANLRSDRVSWQRTLTFANHHFLTAALWSRLQQKDLVADVPHEPRAFLDAIHRLNTARNRRLRAAVLEVVSALEAIGVEPVLLKGAVQLFDDAYQDVGARTLVDLDLLIPEGRISPIVERLAEIGYSTEGAGGWHTHTYSVLFRRGEPWTLDLHRYFGYQRDILTPGDVCQAAVPFDLDGLRLLLPCPTHRIFLNFFHAQIQNQNHWLGTIPLMQLYDFARLCRHHRDAINWERLRALASQHYMERALKAYVHAAVEIFALSRPPAMRADVGSRIHLSRCRLQRRWPVLLSGMRQLGWLVGIVQPLRIRMRYGCGSHPAVIHAFRLRFMFEALIRNGLSIFVQKVNMVRQNGNSGTYR